MNFNEDVAFGSSIRLATNSVSRQISLLPNQLMSFTHRNDHYMKFKLPVGYLEFKFVITNLKRVKIWRGEYPRVIHFP